MPCTVELSTNMGVGSVWGLSVVGFWIAHKGLHVDWILIRPSKYYGSMYNYLYKRQEAACATMHEQTG